MDIWKGLEVQTSQSVRFIPRLYINTGVSWTQNKPTCELSDEAIGLLHSLTYSGQLLA